MPKSLTQRLDPIKGGTSRPLAEEKSASHDARSMHRAAAPVLTDH
jgi:hypothetical protein